MKQYVGSKHTVYIHTNLSNGKVYIGQTNQEDLTRRWCGGHGYVESPHFSRAIKKYGWSGFAHEIIETGLTQEEANYKEQFYIALYNSTNPKFGYNISYGGKMSGTLSEEGRESIRRHSSGPDAPTAKAVDVYDASGKLITTCGTMTEAAKYVGVMVPYMSTACKKAKGTVNGFICHLHKTTKGMPQLPLEMIYRPNEKRRQLRPVAKYGRDGKLICIYPSVKEAAKDTGTLSTEISTCINHIDTRIGAGGFMWRYADNAPEKIKPMPFEPHEEGVHIYSKAVLQIDNKTGKILHEYSSLKEAAKAVGCTSTTIIRAAKGRVPTAKGFKWKYKYE